MYGAKAARYRDTEVMTASPTQLLMIVFDHLLLNLRKAQLALESGNVEQRCAAIDSARQALGELFSSLDHDRGGAVARNLAGVYVYHLAELSKVRGPRDAERIRSAARNLAELREAFATAIASTQAAA